MLRALMPRTAHGALPVAVPSDWGSTRLSLDADLLDLTSLGGGDTQRKPFTGVKALMLAVLDNGMASYFSSVARIREEAECWVNSRSRHSPFSFAVVCDTLGLEPTAVRNALQRLRDKQPRGQRLGRRRPNVTRAGRVVVHKV